MSINDIFKNSLLYDYINGQLFYKPGYQFEADLEKNQTDLFEYINKNKLYDIDYSEINKYVKDSLINVNDSRRNFVYNLLSKLNIIQEPYDLNVLPTTHSADYYITNIDLKKNEKQKLTQVDINENINVNVNSDIGTKKIRDELNEIIGGFDIKDDFLIPIEDDTINYGLLEENDDIVTYKPPEHALSKEKLSILNMNLTVSDIFVERPYKKSS